MKRHLFTTTLLLFAIVSQAQFWSLTGNSGTIPGTNFLGTNDAKILELKVNKKNAGRIGYNVATSNTSFGFLSDTAGIYNSAFGYAALSNNSTGIKNTAIGYEALYSNTSGTNNTANGYSALRNNTTGGGNTANGYSALRENTDGGGNTANGYNTLYFNTTGNGNTANGYSALKTNTIGAANTASGSYALYSNATGSENTASGFEALRANSTGSHNTANGYSALRNNTIASNNTASGFEALFSNINGFNNVATGFQALFSNTTGYNNVATGFQALFSNTTGDINVANGYQALYSNTNGYNNVATGFQALFSNTTGSYNTANGISALLSNTTGGNNTATGFGALVNNTEGFDNTSNGFSALVWNSTGYHNTANGWQALYLNTTGADNTSDGFNALFSNTTGNGNTAIGDGADVSDGTFSRATAIGYNAVATASDQVMLGNIFITSVKAAGSFVIYSDGRYKKDLKEDVPGLSFINQLRPVTYHYDIHGMNDKMGVTALQNKKRNVASKTESDAGTNKAMDDAMSAKEKKMYTGFVAQEVEAAANKLNYDFSGVYKPQNDKDLYGLSYADFVVPLAKAVQELSAKNDSLQSQINELKALMQQVLAGKNITQNISSASLQQNTPNPYRQATAIHYTLPAVFTSAQLMITDNTGKLLKQIPVSAPGAGTVNINAGSLSAGTYNYSLIVDGSIVDTKKMVLLK